MTAASTSKGRVGFFRGSRALPLFAGLLFLSSVVIADLKRPWSDEGWFASPAHNLAAKGFFGTTIIETADGRFDHIDRHTYWVLPLYLLNEALWFRIFGDALWSARGLALAWGLVGLAALYAFVRLLSKRPELAALTVTLAAVDYIFIDAVALARPESMCMALGFSAMAAYLYLRETSLSQAILASQSLMALCALTHPNALLHFSGLALLMLLLDRKALRIRHALLAAIPYAAVFGAWAVYIAQDPQSFWTQIHLNAGDRFDSLKHPLSAIGAEVLRYSLAFGLGPHSAGHASALIALKSFVLALYIAGIVAALIVPKLRSYSYLRLQVLLALLYFTIQLFFNQKLSYYLMHTTPLYCSILAAFLLWAWERRGLMRTAAAGAVAVCIALGAGGVVLRSWKTNYFTFHRPAMDVIRREAAGRPFSVFGSAALGFDFGFDGQVIEDPEIGLISGKTPEFVVMDEFFSEIVGGLGQRNPELYRRVQTTLDGDFSVIYDQNDYRIYRRRATFARRD